MHMAACGSAGGYICGPVANFSRPVWELRQKTACPNFWLWTRIPDALISIFSWVGTGLTERNSVTNRARKNFATGPEIRGPPHCGTTVRYPTARRLRTQGNAAQITGSSMNAVRQAKIDEHSRQLAMSRR